LLGLWVGDAAAQTTTIRGGTSGLTAEVKAGALTGTESGIVIRCASGCSGSGGTSQADDSVLADLAAMGALYDTTPPAITDGRVGVPRMNSDRQLYVDCINCSSTSFADDDPFTFGTTPVAPIAGVFDDVASNTATENSAAVVRITTNKALHINLRNASGTEVGTAGAALRIDPTGTTPQPATQSGTWNITDISGTVSLPTGASTAANQTTMIGHVDGLETLIGTTNTTLTTIDGRVDGLETLIGTTNTTLSTIDGRVDGLEGVLGATGDAAATAGSTGSLSAKQRLMTSQLDSIKTAVETIDNIVSGSGVNITQMNGVNVTMGNGASGTGVQRVTLANDSTGVLANVGTIGTSVTPGTSAAHLGKAEDAAHSSGDTGVATWHVRQDTPATTGADGDYIAPHTNQYGHQFVASICNDPTLTQSVAVSQSALNGNAEVVGLTASQTIYVCGFSLMSSANANLRFVYGTGSACATGETAITGAYPLLANQGLVHANAGAIQFKTASANALCIETSAAANIAGIVTYAKF
jgi:hypothetical protein